MGDGFLVGGGELSELCDGRGNNLNGKVDVSLCGVAAKTEAQTGARFFGRQADGGEDVRRLDSARRASGACGACEALQVKSNEESLPLDAGKNQIRGVRSARSSPAIDARMGHAVQKAVLELIAECAEAPCVILE